MDTTGDNCVVCSCGTPAILLTVKNPSSSNLGESNLGYFPCELLFYLAISGRQFYKCSKRDGGCDFFLWADSPPTTTASVNSTRAAPPSRFGGDDYRPVTSYTVQGIEPLVSQARPYSV